jgi:hypothetical protein
MAFEWLFVPRLPSGSPDLGIPKSLKMGVLQLCGTITSGAGLWLGRGLNQSCSPSRELSNGMSHATYTQGNRVDSQLSVVGSQTASLIPGLSFGHNLCFRCPNGSCEPISDIYTLIFFQWYRELPNARCFDPCNRILNFQESRRTPKSPFWECESHPHTLSK